MTFDPLKHPKDAHGRFATTAGEADDIAKEVAGSYAPLPGLPKKPIKLGDEYYTPGPNETLKKVAEKYMQSSGQPYNPPTTYAKLDADRAKRIAQAFDNMEHNPDDPTVKAAYHAFAKETVAQYDAIKDAGIKVEWIKPGQADPYADSPRRAAMDVAYNKHWWGFPTDLGFGSDESLRKNNPMLEDSGVVIDGHHATYGDVFRVVHDMMGHFKDGNGFRAEGEENAWRSHAAMYSPLARLAMTALTRGQNSWVNYGPYGEQNRTAKVADTHFAPEKIGLLPSWVSTDGASTSRPDIRRDMSWGGPSDQSQPIKTMGELYDKSKKEEAAFRADIQSVASQSGSTVKFPPVDSSEPGTQGMKTMARAQRKATADYGGDVSKIRDVLRASIVGDTVEKTRSAAADFIEAHRGSVIRIKDRFASPSLGYRDILVNFRTPTGLIAEVQFGSKTILAAKSGDGHKIYKEIQDLQTSNLPDRDAAAKALTELESREEKLYNEAYKADGNGSWQRS
jgi:hypothetical protein